MIQEHCLYTDWAFLFHSSSHHQPTQELGVLHTVEDFYRYYCFLHKPSHLPPDVNFICIRKPYIDSYASLPYNGRLLIQAPSNQFLDSKWEDILTTCVSEGFNSINVIAAAACIRKTHKYIAVWLKDYRSKSDKFLVSKKLLEITKLKGIESIRFKEHIK